MTTSIDNAIVSIEFDGEGEVKLGGDEFFVEPYEGVNSVMLDKTRINLIEALMLAQTEATEAAKD